MKKTLSLWKQEIVSTYYFLPQNTKIFFHAQWAPTSSNKDYVSILLKKWYDVIVPEYSWWMRSWWSFVPWEVIQSLKTVYNAIKKGDVWKKYDTIHYLGSSFWWLFAQYIGQFETISLLAPLLFPKELWKKHTFEQRVEDFHTMMHWLYKYLYRGYNKEARDEFFAAHIPSKNMKNVKILHGKKDKVIHYSHSQDFAHDAGYEVHLYPYIDHNSKSLTRKLNSLL